jgi:hypothetical protein
MSKTKFFQRINILPETFAEIQVFNITLRRIKPLRSISIRITKQKIRRFFQWLNTCVDPARNRLALFYIFYRRSSLECIFFLPVKNIDVVSVQSNKCEKNKGILAIYKKKRRERLFSPIHVHRTKRKKHAKQANNEKKRKKNERNRTGSFSAHTNTIIMKTKLILTRDYLSY